MSHHIAGTRTVNETPAISGGYVAVCGAAGVTADRSRASDDPRRPPGCAMETARRGGPHQSIEIDHTPIKRHQIKRNDMIHPRGIKQNHV